MPALQKRTCNLLGLFLSTQLECPDATRLVHRQLLLVFCGSIYSPATHIVTALTRVLGVEGVAYAQRLAALLSMGAVGRTLAPEARLSAN